MIFMLAKSTQQPPKGQTNAKKELVHQKNPDKC